MGSRCTTFCSSEFLTYFVFYSFCVVVSFIQIILILFTLFLQNAAHTMHMTKQVREMKELSRECILARNDAHFTTIKALDNAMLNSKKAIAMFLYFIESHPSQCKTIVNYSHFKTFLKDNFK